MFKALLIYIAFLAVALAIGAFAHRRRAARRRRRLAVLPPDVWFGRFGELHVLQAADVQALLAPAAEVYQCQLHQLDPLLAWSEIRGGTDVLGMSDDDMDDVWEYVTAVASTKFGVSEADVSAQTDSAAAWTVQHLIQAVDRAVRLHRANRPHP